MTDREYQATPRHVLEHQIMSHGEGKNEREWWACHEIEKLRARIAELEAVFETKWDAEQRAIKAWQEKTGKNMTWPDHAKMVEWLLDELDAARAAYLGEKE